MTGAAPPNAGFGLQIVLLGAARLSTVVAFFGVSVVGARVLDPSELGAAAVGQTIGMIAALVANGGINLAAIYFLQRHPEQQAATVQRLVALAIGACSLAVLLVILSAPIAFALVLDGAAWPLMAAAAVMAAMMIAFEFTGALLLGLGRSGRFTALELIRGWGSLASVAILLLGPWSGGGGLVLGLALGYAAAAVMGLSWTGQAGMSIAPRYDRAFSGTALRFGVRGQVGNVFQFLGVRLDLLIVPAMLDLRAAGIYFVAARVSDVVGQAATAASSLVFPRVAGQTDRRSTAITERVTRITLIVVIISALALILAGEWLLGVAFGADYVAGATALAILLVATLPLALGRLLAADLKGRGRPGLVSISAAVAVAATIGFDLALIPVLGIEGAAIASLLTYIASGAVLVWAYRRVTGGSLLALVPRPADLVELGGAARRMAGRARKQAA